jgi:peroxiredoxin
MFVSKGDALPSLVLTRGDGSALRLPEDAGSTSWLLFFPRSASCATGRAQARALAGDADIYEGLGVKVLVVVPESADAAKALEASLELPFPVAASAEAQRAIGLERKVLGVVQESASLLVGPDGHVAYARKSTLPGGAVDEGALLKASRELARPRKG